jgi:hypothetical protein
VRNAPSPNHAPKQLALRIAIASEKKCNFFGSLTVSGKTLEFQTSRYAYVGAPLFIQVWCTAPDDYCGPYCELTKAFTRGMTVELADDEILVKTYAENDRLREPLLSSGYFDDTARRQRSDYAELEVWRITPKFVEEFATANPQWHKVAAI